MTRSLCAVGALDYDAVGIDTLHTHATFWGTEITNLLGLHSIIVSPKPAGCTQQ